MHAVSLNPSSNMKAMVGSIAIHAFIGAWFLSSTTQVEIMPQQMIKVTMIAAPATEMVEQKSDIPPQEKPQPKKVVKPVKTPAPRKESALGMVKPEITHAAPPLPKEQALAALSPSAGNISAAQASAQLVTTAPLFDAAYLNNPVPEYPAQAKRRGMEGSVMLGVVVRQDGTAKSVGIAESSGFAMLDASAKKAVSRWKFIPAKRGDETVEARVMVPIDFRLE